MPGLAKTQAEAETIIRNVPVDHGQWGLNDMNWVMAVLGHLTGDVLGEQTTNWSTYNFERFVAGTSEDAQELRQLVSHRTESNRFM